MRVLVIGGRGHLGSRAVAALARGSTDVAMAGRSGDSDVQVDITRPETLPLESFDAVVNCSDSVAAPPDAAIAHCLAEGGTWLECASEPMLVRRLLAQHRGEAATGRVLLGCGIFTGLSNVLAGQAARQVGPGAALQLGIRWSTFSAGGAGMVHLMTHLLDVPTVCVRAGQAVEGPPLEAGPELPFGDRRWGTLHVPFSEAEMLAASTKARNIGVYAALIPSLLRPLFLLTPGWLLRARPVRALLGLQFSVLRRVLLRWKTSPVELSAVAVGQAGQETRLGVTCRDGMDAAGNLMAAMALGCVERELPRGLTLPDEHFELEPLVDAANGLAASTAARLSLVS